MLPPMTQTVIALFMKPRDFLLPVRTALRDRSPTYGLMIFPLHRSCANQSRGMPLGAGIPGPMSGMGGGWVSQVPCLGGVGKGEGVLYHVIYPIMHMMYLPPPPPPPPVDRMTDGHL